MFFLCVVFPFAEETPALIKERGEHRERSHHTLLIDYIFLFWSYFAVGFN